MKRFTSLLSLTCITVSTVLSACGGGEVEADKTPYWDRISALCGQAFEGKIVSTDAVDDDWRAQTVIMHVRECSDTEIRIPLHVGENRSRTWVLTRQGAGVTLRHDHRHEDGVEDDVSQYGGPSNAQSQSPSRFEFPADAQTKRVFDAADISVSNSNIWAIEIRPEDDEFVYEMARPNRFFRVVFDTKTPVQAPPAPW